MYSLKDQVVVITGAAKGIGAAVVRLLLDEGVKHVTIIDVDANNGTKLQEELNKKYGNGKIKFYTCDVSDMKALFEVFDSVIREHGYIDFVMNNAGIADESCPDSIRKTVEINYTALVNSTLKALELMRIDKGGKGGTVVNVSSTAGLAQYSPSFFVYAGTKSAVLQFSTCIGKEEYFSVTGVRVLTLCFGGTETDMWNGLRSFDEVVNNIHKETKAKAPKQSIHSAATGAMEAIKNGDSGSTWLIANNRPALDMTSTVRKAYEMLSDAYFSNLLK